MSAPPFTRIGRYDIDAPLRRGAVHTVFRGVEQSSRRRVIVRVFDPDLTADAESRARILGIARVTSMVQHAAIAATRDFGEADGRLFIVSEEFGSGDAAALARRRGAASVEQRLDVILQALDGLAYAHEQGLVHGGIKPANLRIAEDGRAMLTDFGLADVIRSLPAAAGAPIDGAEFLAPEQVLGDPVAPPTDVYAIGAVMYLLLAGRPPISGDGVHAVLLNVAKAPVPPLQAVSPDLPAPFAGILTRTLAKALAKSAGQRYQSAAAMAADIRRVRGDDAEP